MSERTIITCDVCRKEDVEWVITWEGQELCDECWQKYRERLEEEKGL